MTIDIDLKDATTGLYVSASSLVLVLQQRDCLCATRGWGLTWVAWPDILLYFALDGTTATTAVCSLSIWLCCQLTWRFADPPTLL
jgi:hypothetical protein